MEMFALKLGHRPPPLLLGPANCSVGVSCVVTGMKRGHLVKGKEVSFLHSFPVPVAL